MVVFCVWLSVSRLTSLHYRLSSDSMSFARIPWRDCWLSLGAINDIVMSSKLCSALCGTARKTGGYGFPMGIFLTSVHGTLSLGQYDDSCRKAYVVGLGIKGDEHYLAS